MYGVEIGYIYTFFSLNNSYQVSSISNLTLGYMIWPNPGGSVVKNPPHCRRHRFDPWVRKIPWRRAWQPTPVILPRKSHGQRSLAGDHGATRVRHN